MATLSINVPNALVPTLVAAADEMLATRQIDTSGMTTTQKAQRYVAEVLKDVYIGRQRAAAQASDTTVTAAVTQATTDAAGIS